MPKRTAGHRDFLYACEPSFAGNFWLSAKVSVAVTTRRRSEHDGLCGRLVEVLAADRFERRERP